MIKRLGWVSFLFTTPPHTLDYYPRNSPCFLLPPFCLPALTARFGFASYGGGGLGRWGGVAKG